MFNTEMSQILETDGYKFGHWKQDPPGTTRKGAYLEPRGGEFPYVVTFGARQYYIPNVLMKRVTWGDLSEAEDFLNEHFGKPGVLNRKMWEHIIRNCDGYLPLKVRAVPEGLILPLSNALLTVDNTDDLTASLPNYKETRLSNMWFPYSVATLSHLCRSVILDYLEKTGDPSLIDFKLHDFGYRGVSSQESAAVGGLAHLNNFMGSDTTAAIMLARRAYLERMAAFTVDATEHSTVTIWGKEEEVEAYRHFLKQYPTNLFACVSDSYNIYEACEKLWGELLRDEVLKRDGVLIIRPDSGNPTEVCRKVVEILGNKFGFTVNDKGYKVLNPKVRVIQGDGVDRVSIDQILGVLMVNGWSADNIGFGMGGALLQKLNRDTMKFAFKCSYAVVNGVERDVYKDPITDPGKVSKRGRLSLFQNQKTGAYKTMRITDATKDWDDVMQTVYENGTMPTAPESLTTIRQRLRASEAALKKVA